MFRRLFALRQFFASIRNFFTRQLFAKFVSLLIIVSMLANTTPAAPTLIYASSLEFGQDLRYGFLSSPTIASLAEFSFWDNPVVAFFLKGRKKQQKVARIVVSPNVATIRTGEQIALTAIALDAEGNPIQGVNFNWKAIDATQTEGGKVLAEAQANDPKKRPPNGNAPRPQIPEIILQNGFFEPQFSGIFLVIAEAGGIKGEAPILVSGDNQLRAMKEENELEKLAADPEAQKRGRKKVLSPASEKFVKAPKTAPVRTSSNPTAAEKQELENWDQAEKEKIKAKPRAEVEKSNGNDSTVAEEELAVKSRRGGPSAEAVEETQPVDETNQANKSENEAAESSTPRFAGAYLNQIDPADNKAKGTADGNGALYGMNYITVYIDGQYAGQTSCATSYYSGSYIGYGSCNWQFQIPQAYLNGVQHTFTGYYSAPNIGSQQFTNTPFTLYSGANPNWNNGNYPTADDPGVQPGNPPNEGTSGAGSGNFSFSAPVISLGGRGMDVNLSLNYNSLLWHSANGVISYDIDKGNPAPGWNIGFGKLMDMDTQGGSMIEDIDGTRHTHEGTIQAGSPGYSTYYGRTTDGSFIDYESYRTPTGISGGKAYLANGTQITYGAAFEGVAYPTYIKDRHGNYITVAYQNNQGPRITTITDNLGRIITFNYDGANRLVSIAGPAQNGGTRIYVRLHYNQMTLSQSFSVLTPAVRNTSPHIIDAIYYPDLNTGYWFADGDSYSAYGMIAKIKEVRGMSWSGANNNDQGTMTQGSMSRQMVYNYPLAAANLTDAPKYTQMSETWANMDTGAAVTSYNINNNANPRTTTITLPNGNKIVQYSKNNPNQWDDGLLYQIETLSPSNQVLSKSVTSWALGDYNSVRVTEIQSTDEKNQTTRQTFSYDPNTYNQVTSVSEFGYGATTPFRTKVNTYENGANYRGYYNGTRWIGGRHIFSLVKTEELLDAGNTRLSRANYNYDQFALTDTPNVVMYDQTYNPSTTQTIQGPNCVQWDQYWVSTGGWWNEWGWWEETGYWESYCVQYEQISAFDTSTNARGNLTQSTTFSDAANLGGGISYDSTYDITGNVRTTTTNCCQQMQFHYTTNTQYSQPDWHKKGSPSDPNLQNVESATYDFNTGLLKTSTNFNGRTTHYSYDDALRHTGTHHSTGLNTQTWYYPGGNGYNELIWQGSSYTHVENHFNGRGQQTLRREYNKKTNNYWDADNFTDTNITYDEMGRKKNVSVPHLANVPTAGWTTYEYDVLSRVKKVTAPDGSISETFYNEANKPSSAISNVGNTVRSRDAWGRERWARTDDFGRIVEVVEPDPNGNGDVMAAGNMRTEYFYNTKDELVRVLQGDQERKFAYDSLGRLVRQKLAEQNKSLNDAGNFVGGDNGNWSDAFFYDNRSNLIQRTDARGVKTNFNYNNDPLNRLQSVTYDKLGADTTYFIHDSSSINFNYMPTGDKTRVSQAQTWWTNETNAYDIEGRVSEYSIVYWDKTSQPLTTSYLYDYLSRLTEVRYPAQYGMAGNPRKVVTPDYDETSRLKELKVDNQIQMSEIVYNPLSQVTQLKTGAATNNADVEQYAYDGQTGLLTNQKVWKANNGQMLLDLGYDYARNGSAGNMEGKTGQLTKVWDNLNHNKDRHFQFDTLGRLKTAKGGLAAGASGVTANWTQTYSYDPYGNRTNVVASGVTQNSQAVPTDGLPSQSYQTQSNRITTAGYIYDLAGNLIRGQDASGNWQRFEYDSGGRQRIVKDDAGNEKLVSVMIPSGKRVFSWEPAAYTGVSVYVWGGSSVIAEYKAAGWNSSFDWAKSYIYAGSRLLSTFTKNGASETLEFHHPDRLGTRLVTNNTANTSFEQNTLPFGTALDAESTGATNQRFTSYDRSDIAKLDYAVNRSYSSGQGRFTSVDPIGMAAGTILNPQSNNLYAYVENNPIDFVDPSGLFKLAPKPKPQEPDWEGFWRFIRDSHEQMHIVYQEETGGGGDPITIDDLVDNAKKIIENSSDECKAMFAKNNALKKLDELKQKGKITFDGKVLVDARGRRGFIEKMPLSQSGYRGTVVKGTIHLNPNRNPTTRGDYSGLSIEEKDNFKSRGMEPIDVATKVLMHELLHVTKYFKPDGETDATGNTKKSVDNDTELLDKCFPKKEGQK